MLQSINWKELRTYNIALERISDLLRGKLIFLKMDNLCAVHYVNAGAGRIPALADLARSIRLLEASLCVETVAVHLPGELNVTADALSRMQISAKDRDRHGQRVLRQRLFKNVLRKFPELTIDGMASDDGHNSQMPRYACPSDSFFELDFSKEVAWVFPPEELIGPTLMFLRKRRRALLTTKVVLLLVPERQRAGWFFHLAAFQRVFRFVSGSDLFREMAIDGSWKRLPATREPWVVLASFEPQQQ
jgi:hypothetical protein